MVKLQILFRTGQRSESYYDSYNRFLIKLDQLPGLRRKTVSSVYGAMGGRIPFDTIVEAYFDDQATLEAALTSEPGSEAGRLLIEFAGPDALALYADVLEESYDAD